MTRKEDDELIMGHWQIEGHGWAASLPELHLPCVIKCIFDRLLSKYKRLDLSKVIANENYGKKINVFRVTPVIFLFLVPS